MTITLCHSPIPGLSGGAARGAGSRFDCSITAKSCKKLCLQRSIFHHGTVVEIKSGFHPMTKGILRGRI
ncbi:hypothetical protein [Bacillus paralicheniformis]|uniref:hypothetical protein n=1 Tax=Bacillus paralicheniformis TaxID=1648923 RepID=UPI0012BB0748|nr:hypothetical protein [Bacillus paralicheniformis]MEC1869964.1 hypothetical protein [Bacillus paralicheniformis]